MCGVDPAGRPSPRRAWNTSPFAAGEVKLMLIEPKGLVNTGDAGGEMTAESDVWV